jgi:oxygen-independent coproporphyrinogen III oxidase
MRYLNSLNLSGDVEITFECAPETIWDDLPKLRAMRMAGITRLNLGIESLNDDSLRLMGRRHNTDMTLKAIDNIREAGFANLNVDLIFGLPHESLQTWVQSLEHCVALQLDSVSVYRLRKHPKKHISKIKSSYFPTYEETIKMQLAHGVVFARGGYTRVQSHKYALTAEKIQKQTEQKRGIASSQLLSAGCGAYGLMNNTFYWNTKSLADYAKATRHKIHPTWLGKVLTTDDLMRKIMALGVHTSRGIDLEQFRNTFGCCLTSIFPNQLNDLMALDLATITNNTLQPTELGYFFGDEISTTFYSPAVKEELSKLGMKYGMFFDNDKYA